MRKKPPHIYFIVFFFLLALMSLPKDTSESLRGSTVAMFAPTWHRLIAFKSFFNNMSTSSNSSQSVIDTEVMQRLRLENTLLRNEISHLKDVMEQELHLISQLSTSQETAIPKKTAGFLKKRHRLELQKLLQLQLEAVPAKVIFRSAASWNSSLWINIGNATNTSLGRNVIAKNSPVIVGNAVVGVVDFVGNQQARVRLITDSGLSPSVRAQRETSQDNVFLLAKGELHGTSKPLWRTNGHLLKGIGFNYDFADDEGPARDLRSGKPTDANSKSNNDSKVPTMPILKSHDLLVTTGMDGVFPPGLLVAEVKTVHLLKEGDYTYELDATPILGNLDELSSVFVIPPVGYDPNEQPPPLGW